MEDVLDPDVPLVCLDETSKQLISETRTPMPVYVAKMRRNKEIEPRSDSIGTEKALAQHGRI